MSDRKVTVKDTEEAASVLEYDDLNPTIEPVDDQVIEDVEIQDFAGYEDGTSVENMPDDEEIWPGGPTAGHIKKWKEQHGEVYVTSISYDKHIVWRVLTRIEYKSLVKKMESMIQNGELSSAEANMWNEEAITELCTLYPKYNASLLTGVMAGMPSLIAQEVLEASGFVALEVRQL